MKNVMRIALPIAAALILILGAALFSAGAEGTSPGTEEDPLVTLSYINEVFTGYLTELFRGDLEEQTAELETGLEERIAALEAESEAAVALEERSTYEVIALEDGQELICRRGTELMLRVGQALVTAEDTPGLVDTSTTENLEDGEYLSKNHMYMVTINEHGIRADGYVMMVVRGEYSIS